jgi:hypothetical protein
VSETDRLLVVRAALMQTTGTPGWLYVKGLAENIVKMSTQAALDEEDPIKGESKRLKAKAMQSGFNDFFSTIETAKAFGTDEEPDWFAKLDEFEELSHGR